MCFLTKERARAYVPDGQVAIYIDMDGVLARWREEASVEMTFAPGYFYDLDPDFQAIGLTMFLAQKYPTFILSKVYTEGYAALDKRMWLAKYGLEKLPTIFVPYKYADKEEYINPNAINILIDDFSDNLHKWSNSGNVAIKYRNGINGTNGTWYGFSIDHRMPIKDMLTAISGIAEVKKQAIA